jgi:cyclophilin family peptidyl-prolyl cis-trans isomerase
MRGKMFVAALIGSVLLGVGLCVAWSQEKTKATGPANTTPAGTAPADGGDFTKLHAEWTALVKEIRKVQFDYRLAKDKEREALRAKFNEKTEQARDTLPKLGIAAEAAFKANPKDADLRDFLLVLAEHTGIFSDDYEQVLHLCEVVVQNGTLTNEQRAPVYTAAAEAAMQLIPPRLDLAEKYLAEAAKGPGKEPPAVKSLRDKLAKEKESWTAEAALRAAEEKAAADPAKALPRVLLKTTKGDILLELFENEAPNTVANFISLVEKGYYKGVAFHRAIPHFAIDGGAAKDDGTGGPGYQIPCECYEMKDGKPIARRHFRGSLTMDNSGRDTGDSHFFICLSSSDDRVRGLDAKFTDDNKPTSGHTVFGRVVSGFDVMAKIQRRDPRRPQDQDVRPDRILEATVIRKRNHPYKPKKVGEVAETPAGKSTEPKTKTDGTKTDGAKTEEKTKTEAKAKTPAGKS